MRHDISGTWDVYEGVNVMTGAWLLMLNRSRETLQQHDWIFLQFWYCGRTIAVVMQNGRVPNLTNSNFREMSNGSTKYNWQTCDGLTLTPMLMLCSLGRDLKFNLYLLHQKLFSDVPRIWLVFFPNNSMRLNIKQAWRVCKDVSHLDFCNTCRCWSVSWKTSSVSISSRQETSRIKREISGLLLLDRGGHKMCSH